MINTRYQLNTEEDVDEGFDRPQNQTQEFVLHARNIEVQPQSFNSLQPPTLKKPKHHPPEKHLLKLDSLQNSHVNLNTLTRHAKAASLIQTRLDEVELTRIEEAENRSLVLKKQRKINRQRSLEQFHDEPDPPIFKGKREIGQDLAIRNDHHIHEQQVKEQLKQYPHSTLAFHHNLASSTHSYFKHLAHNQEATFIHHKYNSALRQKVSKFKQKIDDKPKIRKDIEFRSDFQSGNLELSFKIAENQYNLYVRIDTHTNGHQSWFYFQVINHESTSKRIRLNICNLKRKIKMIDKGQKLFVKRHQKWTVLDEALNVSTVEKKVYKLSFGLSLAPHSSVFIALIPPYTYSQLLDDLTIFQKSPHAKVEVLTYSVSSLAIPIITITKKAKQEFKGHHILKKKLFLVSGRIHPSQTCSSYIINGLIKTLLSGSSEVDAFLNSAIVKIIPMLNPDGVVFGNFRTSYLGDDLNRSFNQFDDAIFPEVTALKELAKTYKNDFGDNFLAFIDMHGHSCRPNSFVYGPEFDQSSEQFVQCRVFPKIFDRVSKYFSYEMSSFKLDEYKYNTARGFFLRKYRIPSYTVETSYALFQDKNQAQPTFRSMSVEEWSELGKQLGDALQIYTDYLFHAKKKNSTQIIFKKKIKQRDDTIKSSSRLQISFAQVHNQICQQITQKKSKGLQTDANSSDSDGQPAQQDLPVRQKEAVSKKVREVLQTSYLFPKAMKPTMILPAIVPSIIVVSRKQKRELNMIIPKLSSKMKPKKFARPLNSNSQFNQYLLKNINGVASLRPDVINFNSIVARKLKEDAQRLEKSQCK